MKFLKKELCLASHPTAAIMLCLSSMVLIPNYPYTVIFFYTTLALFFMCMSGRENNDINYSIMLPVAKSDIPKGRITFAVLLQLTQIILTALFSLLRRAILPMENAAGMEANTVLLAMGFIIYAVFNLTFFTRYYRDPTKIGVPFVISSIVTFVLVALFEALTHTVPFFMDVLDTPDFNYIGEKLILLITAAVFYVISTAVTLHLSAKSFEKIDLSV